MLTQKKMQYDKAGPKVAEALNKRFFEAYYCSDRESGLQKVLELIPQNHVVSWGGTSTVDELGIKDALRQRGQAVIDRDTAKDAQERKEMLKKALTFAVELGTGLLEATEVVEPDPISPNESTSYSNLYHCDRDGVYLYIDMAMKQIAQAMRKDADDR